MVLDGGFRDFSDGVSIVVMAATVARGAVDDPGDGLGDGGELWWEGRSGTAVSTAALGQSLGEEVMIRRMLECCRAPLGGACVRVPLGILSQAV